MIPNIKILEAMRKAISVFGAPHLYPKDLDRHILQLGKEYTVYTPQHQKTRKHTQGVTLNGGKVVELSRGEYWIGLRHSWVRNDEQGKIIADEYKNEHRKLDERWAKVRAMKRRKKTAEGKI